MTISSPTSNLLQQNISHAAQTMCLFVWQAGLAPATVRTSANSALGLVTQGFLGHSIRDTQCCRYIRCLLPTPQPLTTPGCRTFREGKADVSPGGESPGPEKTGCVQGMTVSVETRWMAHSPLSGVESRGEIEAKSHSFVCEEVAKKG